MSEALRARGVPDVTAHLAAELGVLAFKLGHARWADPPRDGAAGELAEHTRSVLEELREASTGLR